MSKGFKKIVVGITAIWAFIVAWSIPICLGGACYSLPLLLMATAAAVGAMAMEIVHYLF